MQVELDTRPGDGAIATPAPGLRVRLRNFVYSWRDSQAAGWDPQVALLLHEELEQIAAEADRGGLTAIAGPALELAVYLCSFIEGVRPNDAQTSAIVGLVAELETASGVAPVAKPAQQPVAAPRVVVYVREPEDEVEGLAVALGRQGYVVRPCDDPPRAQLLVEQQTVNALVVDMRLVDSMPQLVSALERTRGGGSARPVVLAVGVGVDERLRRYAQRVGADAVLDSGDAVAIATRIDELFAQHRALDYRVLIVEDDASQALYAQAILRHRGIASRTVARADEVLPAIAAFQPDLLLLDLYLPEVNGIEIAQLVRERAEHAFLPIVFVSGEQDLDRRFDAIRMGGDDFVTKPVRPRHLLATIEGRIRLARERARRSAGRSGEGERRGALVGRVPFAEALERIASEASETIAALVLIGHGDVRKLLERAGFVGAGAFAQQLGSALSAASDLVRPVCALSGPQFLALARAEGDRELREHIAQLHKRLEARRWISAQDGIEVELRCAAVRVREGTTADDAIARVMALFAQIGPDERCVYDAARVVKSEAEPRRDIARALVRGPLPAEAVRIELLPIEPLAGALSSQFAVRLTIVAPKTRTPLALDRAEALAIARELGTVERSEREQLKHVLRAVAPRLRADPDARIHVDVAVESVIDSAFAPWLAAELRTIGLAPAQIVCVVSAAELAGLGNGVAPALERLQIAGVRLCIGGVVGSVEDLKLVALASVDAVRIDAAETEGQRIDPPRRRALDQALTHGKVTVVAGPIGAAEVGHLLRNGVHYLKSDALAAWAAQPYPAPHPKR